LLRGCAATRCSHIDAENQSLFCPGIEVMQSLGPLANGFYQVSYIVADLDEAEQFFKRTFGVRSFGRLRLKARSTEFKCKPDFPGLSGIVALGDMGGMELELIQPTGPGWYADFLRRKGPGLHHLGFRPGFRTEDFDAAVRFLRGLGHEPVAQGAALFDIPQSDGTTAPPAPSLPISIWSSPALRALKSQCQTRSSSASRKPSKACRRTLEGAPVGRVSLPAIRCAGAQRRALAALDQRILLP
jgi:catechol 2,3-dioxygenase-like lactoylglutathione lyase family enzyme